MKAVLIAGDGIGKEIAQSVKTVNEALNTDIEWVEYQAGAEYAANTNEVFEPGLIDAIKDYKWVLKGPTATPIGTGFRSVNVALRQQFDTFANVRPIRLFKGVPSLYNNIDLVIIRENTEDLYKGIEYKVGNDLAHGIKIISRQACEKICRYAFEYAKNNNRKKVTAVHKANIMKYTDGLFLDVYREVSKEYPEIEKQEVIIDNMCMQLVMRPETFDVIVSVNLYGDILSDLCAGLVGGLGFAPSGNIGDDYRIYEAVHGSAPDIAGKNIANPTALLLAYAMMLEDLDKKDKAQLLRNAIHKVLEKQTTVTKDIGGQASTDLYTQAIIDAMKEE